MIRVAGVLDQVSSGKVEPGDDGLPPAEQLAKIREAVLKMEAAAVRAA